VPWDFIRSRSLFRQRQSESGLFGHTFFAFNPTDTSYNSKNPRQLVADVLNARCNLGACRSAYATLFPGSIVPSNCLTPSAVDLMKRYCPCPNATLPASNLTPGGANTFNPFPMTIPMPTSSLSSLTTKISDKQNLGIYYYLTILRRAAIYKFQAPTPNLLQDSAINNATRAQQINVFAYLRPSARVVNELRLSYFREAQGTFLPTTHQPGDRFCSSAAVFDLLHRTTDVPGVIPSDPKIGITPVLARSANGVRSSSVAGDLPLATTSKASCLRREHLSDQRQFDQRMGRHTTKFGVRSQKSTLFQTLFFDPNVITATSAEV